MKKSNIYCFNDIPAHSKKLMKLNNEIEQSYPNLKFEQLINSVNIEFEFEKNFVLSGIISGTS